MLFIHVVPQQASKFHIVSHTGNDGRTFGNIHFAAFVAAAVFGPCFDESRLLCINQHLISSVSPESTIVTSRITQTPKRSRQQALPLPSLPPPCLFLLRCNQSASDSRKATPLRIQWSSVLSLGIMSSITKLVECPVVARTPRRSGVLKCEQVWSEVWTARKMIGTRIMVCLKRRE